jgi:hypothetical protein
MKGYTKDKSIRKLNKKTEREKWNIRMVLSIPENGKMIKSIIIFKIETERVHMSIQIKRNMKAIGLTIYQKAPENLNTIQVRYYYLFLFNKEKSNAMKAIGEKENSSDMEKLVTLITRK